MKNRIIKVKGKPHLVIIPYADYLEYLEMKGKPQPNVFTAPKVIGIPEEVIRRIGNGESPLKAWRMYRDLTQTALANLAGISASAISLIESGIRPGTIESFKALSRALNVPVKELINTEVQKSQK